MVWRDDICAPATLKEPKVTQLSPEREKRDAQIRGVQKEWQKALRRKSVWGHVCVVSKC